MNSTNNDIIDILFSCQNPSPTEPTPQMIEQQHRIIEIQPRPCNHPKCSTCQHFNPTNFFRSTVTKQHYRIRQSFTCSSNNIIYLITCKKCRKQYVGKTTNSLKERINHHRSTIFTKQQRYISIHFNFPDHRISDLSVQIIDQSSENLDKLEKYWISTLRTIKPKGLNYTI